MNISRTRRSIYVGRRVAAWSLAWALVVPGLFAVPATAQTARAPLTEEQRIAHVLDRLGFGARLGDVERVKRVGLERYLEAQLRPEKLDDAVADAKLQSLPTLRLSVAELYAKYPQPGQLIKQLQRQGKLPADLAALRAEGKNSTAQTPPPMNGQMSDKNNAVEQSDGNGMKQEYRAAVRDYFVQNNLLPPQRITAELQASRILRAVYSERQLQEALVDFWTNHFNVFANKGADRWLLVAYDRDTIRPHALGKFQDLLIATAQSPAMLFYLDNFQSVSPNAAQGGGGMLRRRQMLGDLMRQTPTAQMNAPQLPTKAQPQRMKRGINENYARELMELHTLGVDGGYTQKDVQEVARCFTGWTIFDPRGYAARAGITNPDKAGTFNFNARQHDNGEKLVLGHKIPAGGGINDGLKVLDILAHQPATAKFVATKLARRFVMDNPSPALVNRVAAAFTKSDGDIAATMRALIQSPEFNSSENYRAKIKTPFELAVSAVRALGAETNGGPALHQWIAKMGEPLYQYQAPTGYPDTAEAWVNTGALLERINFALALAANRIPGTRVQLARFVGDMAANGGASLDKAQVVDSFARALLQGDLSAQTKARLLKQLEEVAAPTATQPAAPPVSMSDAADKQEAVARNVRAARRETQAAGASVGNPEVARIAALILGSPEFQRQ